MPTLSRVRPELMRARTAAKEHFQQRIKDMLMNQPAPDHAHKCPMHSFVHLLLQQADSDTSQCCELCADGPPAALIRLLLH